ncbi:MAG: glucokinase [Solirubrobacteraceae bacterium]|nr:glucokinase [Solirubrobacteraceae bacterium]
MIGVDLGGTKLLAGVVDEHGRILARERRLIGGLPLEGVLDALDDAVSCLGAEGPVGVGVPALMDLQTGVAVRCNHLPLDGVRVANVFGERLGRRVRVDNDATCAVLAEWQLGAARGLSHVALLTLGTGIGGGLVLDGAVYRGAVGAAAELGHVPVDLDGPPCFGDCPGRGCLEALCSGSALARDAAPLFGPITGEQVTRLALEGDARAVELLRAMGEKLGAGLAGIAMTLNPELIVVGGGVMAAGELLLGPARAELRARALAPSRAVPVVPTALGEDAGMIGAALL